MHAAVGVSIPGHRRHSFIEVSTRSAWAIATWSVFAVMVWFGIESPNWILLILSPFMMGAAIMQTLGRICVLIQNDEVRIFEGVGGIGRTVKVAVYDIQSVIRGEKSGRGGSTTWIEIQCPSRVVKFGRHLSDEQNRAVIEFLLGAIGSKACGDQSVD